MVLITPNGREMGNGFMGNNKSNAGLTRNECLVVGSLLFLLVTVAIPFFTWSARETATRQSAHNLMQWGIALNLYLTDHENRLPGTGSEKPSVSEENSWYNALPVYLSQQPLTALTAEERPRPGLESLWVDPAARLPKLLNARPGSCYFSYGMNRWLQPSPSMPPWKVYDLQDPAATVFLVEVSQYEPGALPGQVEFRHGGKSSNPAALGMALFCDGHVDKVTRAGLVGRSEAFDPEAVLQAPTWIPFRHAPPPEQY